MSEEVAEKEKQLQKISFSKKGISGLDRIQGIEDPLSIGTMDISFNSIIDIQQISNYTNLTVVNISNNKLQSLNGIDNCINISDLNLNNNFLADLSQLQFLKKLKNLSIANNLISSIKQLGPIVQLKQSLKQLTLVIPGQVDKIYQQNKIAFQTEEINAFIKEFFPDITYNVQISQLKPEIKELYGKATVQFKNDEFEYEGDILYMMPHGHGKIKYFKSKRVFEGTFSIGIPVNGIETTEDYTYKGQLNEKGLKYGQGLLQTVNGDIYEGLFVNDLYNGKGSLLYSDGSLYEGEFNNGQRSGQGTYYDTDGSIFTGQWINDQANGPGRYEDAEGNVEEGTWQNNEKLD